MTTQQLCPNILGYLAEQVAAISDQYLITFASQLSPVQESDTALGTLHDADLKRLWCSATKLWAMAHRAKAEIQIVDTIEEQHLCKEMIGKYTKLAQIAVAMFWAEVRDSNSAWSAINVGVRQDWMVVKTEEDDGGGSGFAGLFKLVGGQGE